MLNFKGFQNKIKKANQLQSIYNKTLLFSTLFFLVHPIRIIKSEIFNVFYSVYAR